jgi:NadR type nicotinamide-nucleotide adenylyltransferase
LLRKVSITGPESTGKTNLSKGLAHHYNTVWVHEYAVDYLSSHGTEYSISDVLAIARGQLEIEQSLANIAHRILFCDTDFLVTKIWCKEVFKKVPSWIESMVVEHQYDLYLLCSPDIEWEEGPFRENPHNRDYLFELYLKELVDHNFNYRIIKGKGKERLKNAINFVDQMLLVSGSTQQ